MAVQSKDADDIRHRGRSCSQSSTVPARAGAWCGQRHCHRIADPARTSKIISKPFFSGLLLWLADDEREAAPAVLDPSRSSRSSGRRQWHRVRFGQAGP